MEGQQIEGTPTTLASRGNAGRGTGSPCPMASPGAGDTHAKSSRTQGGGDRFIPSRNNMDVDCAKMRLMGETEEEGHDAAASPSQRENTEEYRRRLADNLLDGKPNAKVLSFKEKAPPPPAGHENGLARLYTANTDGVKPKKQYRHVPQHPERILDAPELVDDYYLNLLDWGSENVLAIALGTTVYLWNAGTGDINELTQTDSNNPEDFVTAVQWAADGKHVAVGTNLGSVEVHDADRLKRLRVMRGHASRVSSLAWNGGHVSSGSRDSTIMNHDVRIRDHLTSTLTAHTQEVCGLKWSPSGQQLASGGNDNLLHIWDANGISRNEPAHRLEGHQAAVKALAWCPFQSNLLASGGGTTDRCIRFWNTHTGAMLNSIDTKSQVCALQWNRHEREILSSHGFSQHQLCLWKYPSMHKMAELTGHSQRVLHMAQSPDGRTVVSAAADETLRFWQCFGESQKKKQQPAKQFQRSSLTRNIR